MKRNKNYNFNLEMYKRFQYAHLESKPEKVKTAEEQTLEILKCKYNILYYLENYAQVGLPGGGSTRLVLNDKLRTVALLFQSSTPLMFQTARQSSKTTIILAATAHYMNFFQDVKMLFYNMKIPDNKKNIAIVKQMISFLPEYMKTYDPKRDPSNVESFKNGINSEVLLKTVDRIDPEASGRGQTAAIFFDEFAFTHNIHRAFSPISFVYSNYARISRNNYIPAPMCITSTPADPITPEGELFQKKWESAYEVEYETIKDMLPHEIYEYIFKNSETQVAKVFQNWFEYPDRCKPELYDENNPDNILQLLNDPYVDINELSKYSPEAAEYLKQVRSIVTSKTKLRQEVYCEFISSADQTIFDEDFLESIPRMNPIKSFKMPNTITGQFDLFREYNQKEVINTNYALCVDPAYRVKGDWAGIVLFNLEKKDIEATAKLRLGKINNLVEVVKFIYSMYPTSVVVIERNNFGIAVIERLLEDSNIRSSIFYSYGNKDVKKMSDQQKIDNRIYGIQTDSGSRPKMLQMLIKFVLAYPDLLKSKELINELVYLQEKKNGRVEAMTGMHDDLVMALAFILYLIEYKERDLKKFMRLGVNAIANINNISMLNNRISELTHTDKFILKNPHLVNAYDENDDSFNLSAFKKDPVNNDEESGRKQFAKYILDLNKL